MNSSASIYRPELDGLRALAVTLVVAFHAGFPGTQGGFIGVDVFFVLSGFLISSQLLKELRSKGRLALGAFYARRIRRLLPASALTVLVTLAAAVWLLSPAELAATAQASRASALYLANGFFAINAADYFAADVKTNPLLHLWSLAVEEQFYFFWPVLLWFAMGGRSSSARAVAVLAGVALISLALCGYLTAHSPSWGFFSPLTRAWEFAAGALAAELPRPPATARMWATRLGWLSLAALLYSAQVMSEQAFPGWIALWPVLATALVLWALRVPQITGLARLLSVKPLVKIGQLSYSWYLWHWPVLVLTLALAPQCSLLMRSVAALGALAIAALAHTFVENPLRHHQGLARQPVRAFVLAGGLMLATVGLAQGVLKLAAYRAGTPQMLRISAAISDIAQMDRKACVSLRDASDPLRCEYGDATSPTHLVLFGDSHAIQWFDALQPLVLKHGWHLTTLLKSGCPAGDLTPPGLNVVASRACQAWRAQALEALRQVHPTLVILSSATPFVGTEISADNWERALKRTVQAIQQAGARALVIRDTPRPGFNVPACLARAQAQGRSLESTCAFEERGSLNEGAARAERAALGLPESADAAQQACSQQGCWLDLADALCAQGRCVSYRQGAVVFRDDNHLTGRFAATLSERLEPGVRAALH